MDLLEKIILQHYTGVCNDLVAEIIAEYGNFDEEGVLISISSPGDSLKQKIEDRIAAAKQNIKDRLKQGIQ